VRGTYKNVMAPPKWVPENRLGTILRHTNTKIKQINKKKKKKKVLRKNEDTREADFTIR